MGLLWGWDGVYGSLWASELCNLNDEEIDLMSLTLHMSGMPKAVKMG